MNRNSALISKDAAGRALGLFALSIAALLIHGYHPYAEDAEIYLPGILKILDPRLFPANSEFFAEHAGHSFYAQLISLIVRITHLPLPWIAFLCQVLCIFALLAASWRLASALFPSSSAALPPARAIASRWASVALMASLLTLPIAGTALYILDQYLNPRNLAAFAALFAVAETLHKKFLRALLWLVFATLMHTLMASFAILFCTSLLVLSFYRLRWLGFAAALPFGLTLQPPPASYHEVALRQRSHFVLRWDWYEWLGVIAPVLLFAWLARWARRRSLENLELVSRAMVPFILIASAFAIVLGSFQRFEALARLQPLRCMALCYMILIVIAGSLLGEYVLRRSALRWLLLFIPLCLGMFFAQRLLFPASRHIEWPGSSPRNPWAQAFLWIRQNTPPDALFALNPDHMNLPGEDEIGFRALAERSRLADLVKDKGASSMFPPLSVDWTTQINAQENWTRFGLSDFQRLRREYGVRWIVWENPPVPGLSCPYANSAVRVCKIED